MAFKMKGFPYKSGFKHTGGTHEDHHQGGAGEAPSPTGEEQNVEHEGKSKVIHDPRNIQQLHDRATSELESLKNWMNSDARTKYPAAEPSVIERVAELEKEIAGLQSKL